MSTRTVILLFSMLMVPWLTGCHHPASPQNKGTGDACRTDSFISLYKDAILEEPAAMKERFLDFRKTLHDSISYYKATVFAAFCCYHNARHDSASLLLTETGKFCQQQERKSSRLHELEGYLYNYSAVMLQESNNRDSAIACLHKAYDALAQSRSQGKLPDICINLADNYFQNGDCPQAIAWYRKALLAADSLGTNSETNHAIYSGMARIYTEIENFPLADYYYRLAEKDYERLSPYEKFFFANTRGNYYYINNQYRESLPWFHRAHHLAHTFKNKTYRAITESNLGETYLLMGKNDSARYFLDKAGEYLLANNHANASMRFYFDGLYAALALNHNELDEAQRLLSKPYDLNNISPNYIYLRNKRLEELYARKGDYAQAYAYSKLVRQYDDSLRNIKALNNIAEIDSRYRQDTLLLHRDILIAQNKAEALQFRNLSMTLAFVLVLLIAIVAASIVYGRHKREQYFAKQMMVITQLRMENVRNRISPHFIFNTLNVIIPALRQYENLAQPLHLLVKSIRNNLLISEKMAITLSEEIGIVHNFLELKKSISKDFPQVHWNIHPDTDTLTLIPSMIIQIPVENAIKYAFESEGHEEKRLTIAIKQTTGNLLIHIEDNGSGYAPGRYADTGKGTGTGLKVLFRTIELLNTQNQQKINIKIDNLRNINNALHGTRVLVEIPSNFNYKL